MGVDPGSPRKHFRELSPEIESKKQKSIEDKGDDLRGRPEDETPAPAAAEENAEIFNDPPPNSSQREFLSTEDAAAEIPIPPKPALRHRQLHRPSPSTQTAATNIPDTPITPPLRFSQLYPPPGLPISGHPPFHEYANVANPQPSQTEHAGPSQAQTAPPNESETPEPAEFSPSFILPGYELSDSSSDSSSVTIPVPVPISYNYLQPGEHPARIIFNEHCLDLFIEILDYQNYNNDAMRKAVLMKSAAVDSLYNLREGALIKKRAKPISQWEGTSAGARTQAWRAKDMLSKPSPLSRVVFPDDMSLGGGLKDPRSRSAARQWASASPPQALTPQRNALG